MNEDAQIVGVAVSVEVFCCAARKRQLNQHQITQLSITPKYCQGLKHHALAQIASHSQVSALDS
jgi:hypothetical protein